jgi:cellulose synthase/poly-beta-1,6-N-acetylglucosamine synthase-like glycosyltransferase
VGAYNALKWREDRALALRLAEARRAPRPALTGTPKVSIIVAAWNEVDMIQRHLESVRALSYPDVEYFLCAGGTDGTYALAQRTLAEGMMLLEQQVGDGKQAALRRCLAHATGEIVYLTDADCLLDDDSFERTTAPVINGEAEAATGGSSPFPNQLSCSSLVRYRWAAETYIAARTGTWTTGLLGRNTAVTRNALRQAKDLTHDVRSGTDYHLAKCLLREGLGIRYVRQSGVVTPYATDWQTYARQQRRWLRNVIQIGADFRATNEITASMITIATGVILTSGPFLAVFLGRWALLSWIILFFQACLSKLRRYHFAIRSVLPQNHGTFGLSDAVVITIGESLVSALGILDVASPRPQQKW